MFDWIFQNLTQWLGVGVILILGGVGWYFITYRTRGKYSVKGIIFETRADNQLYPILCKAGRFKNSEGKHVYKLKFPKFPFGRVHEMKPIDFDRLYNGAGQFLFAVRTSIDQIVPCAIKIETIKKMFKIKNPDTGEDENVEKDVSGLIKIKLFDEDLRPFVIEEIRRAQTRYLGRKSLWDKYQGVILIIIFALSIAIIMYSASAYWAEFSKVQILS